MMVKRLLLFIIIFIIAASTQAQQENYYLANWKKVEQLELKGLTKSALSEVLKIYALAVKDNNDAQQIKASIYQIKYRSSIDEDNDVNSFFFVDTLAGKAKSPARNILLSMQAEILWQYLQNHRWQFYNRTTLAKEKSNDISTWSIDKINSTVADLYKASLANETVLKNTKLNGYNAILVKGENTRKLRPTLYDFLAQRALSFFMNDERDVTKPAYAFTLNDARFFASANEFANISFSTKDTLSLYFKAILLLQDVLKFHLKDASPSALIDADIIRLGFVNDKAVMENKEALYEKALRNIETSYPNDSVTAQAIYLRANIYYSQGQDYDPLTKISNQYEIKKAKGLCDSIIKKYPGSEGGVNAENLLGSILHPSLNLETEQVNIPNQPFRSLIKYKNVKTIYLRIIKTSKEEIDTINKMEDDIEWKYVANLKSIKSWNISLPDQQDYQQHSVEIKIDSLSSGAYFILVSADENFSLKKNIIARQTTYVSNISYINNKNNYYVLNRDNGKPLPRTIVQVWETNYNSKTRTQDERKAEKYTTDKNGFFKLKQSDDSRNYFLQFTNTDDDLFINDSKYENGYDSDDDNNDPLNPTTFLFTDRSIYRPGQTVYFKGIVVQKNKSKTSATILPRFKAHVILKDANGTKVNDLNLITNEYGSYHGFFKLPEGLLNGQFSISDDSTDVEQGYFNVEEYKRPTFTVIIKKPAGTYRLNDSIKVIGNANAYSGNAVDMARVKYTVIRKVQYPYWYYGYRPGRYGSSTIANGEVTTNEKGEFIIAFKALSDESIDKKSQPIFDYEISADVTDISGETRSGETNVTVTYQSLQLNIEVADKLPADSLKNIVVRTTNMNGIEEKTIATLTIQKLKSPDKIFRDRYWQQPDQFIMSKDEYYSYFPYDVYQDENKVKNYAIVATILENTDSTNTIPKIENIKLQSGWYKIVATAKDKYGEEVRDEKYIQLTTNDQQTNDLSAINIDITNVSVEPGQEIRYSIRTGFDNIWLIHTLIKMDKKQTTSYQTIERSGSFNEKIVATEADRGGIAMCYVFVKHNRVCSNGGYFTVPWSNKELNIEYNTFRDKVLPGSQEKWSVKINGDKSEKVSAEILVSMYDESLDQFEPHSWSKLNLWPKSNAYFTWNENHFEKIEAEDNDTYIDTTNSYNKSYDQLLDLKIINKSYYSERRKDVTGSISSVVAIGYGATSKVTIRGMASLKPPAPLYVIDGILQNSNTINPQDIVNIETLKDASAAAIYGAAAAGGVIIITTKKGSDLSKKANQDNIKLRKDFNETAFFYPDLQTDQDGNVSFNFTIPETLTKWKLMTFAHTKDLASCYSEKTIITQKPLMVQANAPRFLREGDTIGFSAKIVNLSDSTITGNTQLELLDASTNQPVNNLFKNSLSSQPFAVQAGQSIALKFPISIPQNFNAALTYRIIAKSSNSTGDAAFSDGEEMTIPVLTNRTLVTESMPLNIRNTSKKDFTFEKLMNNKSATLTNHALTVEFTSNPAWYAVQALPYLIEYPYECAEQTFNRYYANTLATYISNSTPKIKAVFDKWRNVDTAALLSNLQKNEDLKSVLLQETPWVLNAQNESQQKKNIALLFDMARMSAEQQKALDKLKDMQSGNGAFTWFKGGLDDRYITQYILTGIGHLRKLNALNSAPSQTIKNITDNALVYLDEKIKEDYDNLIKYKVKLSTNNLGYTQIQYLYMRSFFSEYKIPEASQAAYHYYKKQAQQYWLSNDKYMQAMIALALYRTNDSITAKAIIRSLKENSISDEELGMYWKEWTTGGYYWYQAPIESQALMIEAFTDIDKNTSTVNDLKTWLLKQKQTQSWKTTKATAEACYALLLNGSNWLNEEKNIEIRLGDTVINSSNQTDEAGTGYFKKTIEGNNVNPAMGNISVSITSPNNQPVSQATSWGSVYWQYFENLDKITPAETPLKLTKKLFIEKKTDKGPVLIAVDDTTTINVGDKIKVRIELRVDRDMEYVHMKDMRAACMEPTDVLSEYKYQDGLGYYQSTKDASTNFFFDQLLKGTYIFEYSLFVTHSGNFSNGITNIECMYAPEFSAHSEGIRITVH